MVDTGREGMAGVSGVSSAVEWSADIRRLAGELYIGPAGRNIRAVVRLLVLPEYGGHTIPYNTVSKWKYSDNWDALGDQVLATAYPHIHASIQEAALAYTLKGVHRMLAVIDDPDAKPEHIRANTRTLAEIAGIVGKGTVQQVQVNLPPGASSNGAMGEDDGKLVGRPGSAGRLDSGERSAISDRLAARVAALAAGGSGGDSDGG